MTNEFIDQENYAAGYEKSAENLKNKPEVIELDRLCYEVFAHNTDGKKLLEIFEKRFLIPALVHPNNSNYPNQIIFYEGFKEAFRMLKHSVESHQQRIDAEKDKK
jgi:hypothetical protein